MQFFEIIYQSYFLCAGDKSRNAFFDDENTSGAKRSQSRKKISESKKKPRAKRKKHQFLNKFRVETANVTSLNETLAVELDLSCSVKTQEREFIKASRIENAYAPKYSRYVYIYLYFYMLLICLLIFTYSSQFHNVFSLSLFFSLILFRKRNMMPPHNRYYVAIYKCLDGYVLENPAVDKLYCKEGTWIGSTPKCIQQASNCFRDTAYSRKCIHLREERSEENRWIFC